MNWLQSSTDKENQIRKDAFWENLRSSLQNGTFWADRIAQFRDQPIERLRLAVDQLPLPAAFKEAAIAVRALIRERIERNEDPATEKSFLYWLAAVESFGLPYSELLQQPGFNVMQTIPGDVIKALPFTYDQLGYRYLTLLKKTDVKWCLSAWGEPTTHTTLNALHHEVWSKYEIAEKNRQEKEQRMLWTE